MLIDYSIVSVIEADIFDGIMDMVDDDPDSVVKIFYHFLEYSKNITAERVNEFIERGINLTEIYDDIGFDGEPMSFLTARCQARDFEGLEELLETNPEYPTREDLLQKRTSSMFDYTLLGFCGDDWDDSPEEIQDFIELIQAHGNYPMILDKVVVETYREIFDEEGADIPEFMVNFINKCEIVDYNQIPEQ